MSDLGPVHPFQIGKHIYTVERTLAHEWTILKRHVSDESKILETYHVHEKVRDAPGGEPIRYLECDASSCAGARFGMATDPEHKHLILVKTYRAVYEKGPAA